MKVMFIMCTALFWLAVGLVGTWGGSGTPDTPAIVAATLPAATPTTPPRAAPQATPPAAAASAGDRTVSRQELARHATPADCWMAIAGQVYDLSAYLPMHPSEPALIEPWCGRDASEGWDTKGLGRPHSKRAAGLLPRYRIGRLG